MITIKKLKSLKESTMKRKFISILRDVEDEITESKIPNISYLKSLFELIVSTYPENEHLKNLLKNKLELRNINNIRHLIMKDLNIEPSEWDFYSKKDTLSRENILPINIYLDDLRSPFNIGSIFRSAECFAAKNIFISENCTSPSHNRSLRTSMGTVEKINWEKKDLHQIDGPIFSLELGGTPIDQFEFPAKGTVIIGSEELGVSPLGLELSDKSLGRVSIPLYGSKTSLNVANATSILLQKWCHYLMDIKK